MKLNISLKLSNGRANDNLSHMMQLDENLCQGNVYQMIKINWSQK